ncbi:hypothetical protein Amme_160_005 [Acidomonas methanolica NBRC 104435]|uniref:Uncharacterized protein n=1 Tax=Acidomonas methanolica NBRC 104435 TaxID=1231351 RepID=A0A023D9L0_ACIMT|nr:hypothetical protein Amme_160_005 [Acidomonas methanolica NBRC 104435]GEK99428.1 hypothetical protein AME01nite_19270 [Acidomonas methanolica NBRC 104435]
MLPIEPFAEICFAPSSVTAEGLSFSRIRRRKARTWMLSGLLLSIEAWAAALRCVVTGGRVVEVCAVAAGAGVAVTGAAFAWRDL